MKIPTGYISPDNNLQIVLNQSRNDGSIGYSVSLQVDRDKHDNGVNLIDCLVLNDVDISTLFVYDILPTIA